MDRINPTPDQDRRLVAAGRITRAAGRTTRLVAVTTPSGTAVRGSIRTEGGTR